MDVYNQAKEGERKRRGISIKRTAYHEAGHAVMAYNLRLRIRHATIIPEEEYLGRVKHSAGGSIHPEWESGPTTRTEIERRAIVALSGNVAEYLLTGRRYMVGSEGDYQTVVNLLSYLAGPEETGKYIEWLWYRTKGILAIDYWWLAIQRLAEELLKHHYLKSKRIREIIRLAIDEDFERKVQSRK